MFPSEVGRWVWQRGRPLPLGASHTSDGVNFALFCRQATAVWLVLAESEEAAIQAEIPLVPHRFRTVDHWHVRVSSLPDEFAYGYWVDGPSGLGYRYDPSLVLLDPMSRSLSGGRPWGTPGPTIRRSPMTRSLAESRDELTPRVPRIP